jgi:hypothetical protein
MLNKSARPFIYLFLILAMASLACGIDWGDETQTAPEQQSSEPTQEQQSAEPTASEEVVATGQQFGTFEFDAPDDNWQTVLNVTGQNTNVDNMSVDFEDGFMRFNINTKQLWTYINYTAYEYENVRIDARVENLGVNNNNISMICRYSESDGWYEFNVANNGLWWIYHGLLDSTGKTTYTLIYNGGSNDIHQGKDVNEYGAVCNEHKLTLYINGKEVRTVEDNKFLLRNGQVGISVSSFDDLPVKVDFDWVKISEQ